MERNHSERNKSRRKTPWDGNSELTPMQSFISRQYEEHYMQRHPKLDETGEVDLINSFIPEKCPYCGNLKFSKMATLGLAFKDINAPVQNVTKLSFLQLALSSMNTRYPLASGLNTA